MDWRKAAGKSAVVGYLGDEEGTAVSSFAGWDRQAAGRVVRMLGPGMEVMIQGQSRSRLQWSFRGETPSTAGNVGLGLRALGRAAELGFRVTSI